MVYLSGGCILTFLMQIIKQNYENVLVYVHMATLTVTIIVYIYTMCAAFFMYYNNVTH
jgi:hypothetical protein